MVYLKLRPFFQRTLTKSFCQKLAAKFYGPFKVLWKIGHVAYRLELPDICRIHSVFHVFQLKQILGKEHVVTTLHVLLEESDEFILQPQHIHGTRYDAEGPLEAVVQWKGLPIHESAWITVKAIARDYPNFELEDKLSLTRGY